MSSLLFPVFRSSRENSQPENMYDIIFEKTEGVYADATVQRVLLKRLYQKFRRIYKQTCAGISFFDRVKLYRSAASFKRRL